MQASDGKNFRNVITGMCQIFGVDSDAPLLDAYWIALRDWEYSDFYDGAVHLMKTSRFMPRPADWHALAKAGKDSAGEVFASLRQHIEYSPEGWRVKRGTPRAIEVAISVIGGAHAYAMCDPGKLTFLERRFTEHYEQLAGKEETRKALPHITGDFDASTPSNVLKVVPFGKG